jgi:hypothetical protein
LRRLLAGALAVVGVLSSAPAAGAQTARNAGTLTIAIADQTGAVIPGASVTITPQDGTNRAPLPPQLTTPEGVATFTGLPPGRFTVQAEFPGFETGTLRDVRVRTGETRQTMALAIQKVEDTVTVGQDPAAASADRRGISFGTVLTREQMDALSDDPDELRRQLGDLAGPGAVIKVDSFEGAQLPPKAQIRMIRISRDQFAAENHGAGGLIIDIVTQPGMGPMRGGFNTRIQDGSMTGRSPFVENKGPERQQQYGFNLGGTIVPERTSFNFNVNSFNAFDTPILRAALVDQTRSETLSMRRPRKNGSVNGNLDHALTKDQTLRFSFNRSFNSQRNLGIGDYNLPERAYEMEGSITSVRAQHVGPLGRRFFTNTRVQFIRNRSESFSQLEAPTIRVLDAFTSGGQQVAGGSALKTLNVASDLDYVRGRHSMRVGVLLDGLWHRSDSASNYLGTYTFESLEAFAAGTPRSYSRRIGDPNIRYFNLQGGLYVQDDIRIRPNLTLTPGVRYEMQTHVRDYNNVAPRAGITWSPGTGGRTSIRASAGLFYDWLGSGTYEQTLRVDGFRQQELNIPDPTYPDPSASLASGIVLPINRYLLGDGVRMPRQLRFSGGVDRGLTRQSRIGFTYFYLRGTSLQRGRNLNAPLLAVRPDPRFGNVIEVVSDAASRQHNLNVFFNASFTRPNSTPPPPTAAPGQLATLNLGTPRSQPLFDWRRFGVNANYTTGSFRNNTDGDFSVAPTGDLEREWGYANGDVRHRLNLNVNGTWIRNVSMSVNANFATGTPYTLQTGFDDNGDLIFNDRPRDVTRNTERATGQFTLNGSVSYQFTFGKPVTVGPGQGPIAISSGPGGALTVVQIQQPGRYRISVFAQGQNLLNRANYAGYSGVMTSRFFGQPTTVLGTRRIDIGISLGF